MQTYLEGREIERNTCGVEFEMIEALEIQEAQAAGEVEFKSWEMVDN